MSAFLKQWGTLIVASTAFILSLIIWIQKIWERYVIKGSIEIHETSKIELTYGVRGEMIGLHGTLLAIGKDVFVRHIELSLVRLKDNSTHKLDWALFAQDKVIVAAAGASNESTFELPHGFIVLTSQPYTYYVHFADRDFETEARPIGQSVTTEWNKVFGESIEIIKEQTEYDPDPQEYEFQRKASKEIYSEFVNCEVHTDAWQFFNKHCYLEPGRYELQMVVKTSHPEEEFEKNWQFELTADDSHMLQTNSILILMTTCGQPVNNFSVAFAKYE